MTWAGLAVDAMPLTSDIRVHVRQVQDGQQGCLAQRSLCVSEPNQTCIVRES